VRAVLLVALLLPAGVNSMTAGDRDAIRAFMKGFDPARWACVEVSGKPLPGKQKVFLLSGGYWQRPPAYRYALALDGDGGVCVLSSLRDSAAPPSSNPGEYQPDATSDGARTSWSQMSSTAFDGYNQAIAKEDLHIEDESNAIEAARLFVRWALGPGSFWVLLGSAADIDTHSIDTYRREWYDDKSEMSEAEYLRKVEQEVECLKGVIFTPKLARAAGGAWLVRVHIWEYWSGDLAEANLTLDHRGRALRFRGVRIAEHVGSWGKVPLPTASRSELIDAR